MGTVAAAPGTTEYRVVLVQPESHGVLALASAGSYRLPRVRIPSMSRPAQQLQKAIKATWGVDAFILDFPRSTHGTSFCAVMELLSSPISSALKEVAIDRIMNSELTSEERHECQLLLESGSGNPMARVGWIDEAIRWVASATGRRFSAKKEIVQLNAGGGFALLWFRSNDGGGYWLKATSTPNEHELSITTCLAQRCPEFSPRLIAIRQEWNAWLMEDAGELLTDPPGEAALAGAVRSFASLQVRTVDAVDVLLAAGTFDQRFRVLRRHLDEVILFLIDAMAQHTSKNVTPLSRDRVVELGKILHDAFSRLEVLKIPDALIHNDLNLGNILCDGTNCVFIDWSEGAIGNPFLSLERLRLLSKNPTAELNRLYGEYWREYLTEETVDRGLGLTPLLSIFAYLYGRGDWLEDTSKVTPQFESYARSLARHMDRAAQNPELLEALCR